MKEATNNSGIIPPQCSLSYHFLILASAPDKRILDRSGAAVRRLRGKPKKPGRLCNESQTQKRGLILPVVGKDSPGAGSARRSAPGREEEIKKTCSHRSGVPKEGLEPS